MTSLPDFARHFIESELAGLIYTLRNGGTADDLVADDSGEFEANPDEDRISYEAPLGQALMGKHVGDIVEIQVPAGTSRYEVIGLSVYEGEPA